jgi:Integrase zinc binding domain/PHD-finger
MTSLVLIVIFKVDMTIICEGCERCFHLRCLVPPRSIVPSGSWFCPACDPYFGERGGSKIAELKHGNTLLIYHEHDPYLNEILLQYIFLDHSLEFLSQLPPNLALNVRRRGSYFKRHPKIEGWLMVYKKIRNSVSRWLVCPRLPYRWDVIAMVHDVMGHPGISQTLTILHQNFHWVGVKEDITTYIHVCDNYQKLKVTAPIYPPLQKPILYGPLNHVHIDLFGPYDRMQEDPPQGTRDKTKVWVVNMIDYFTKVAELAVVSNKTPLTVAFFGLSILRGYVVMASQKS